MIDFTLTVDQQNLQTMARKFAHEILKPCVIKSKETPHDTHKQFLAMKPAYEKAHELGFATGFVPDENGNVLVSNIDLQIAAEEIAAVDPGFACIMLVNGLAMYPIHWYASDEQKNRWLPLAHNDNHSFIAGWSVSEPAGTANFDNKKAGIKTTAIKVDNGYHLTGAKMWPSSSGGWSLTGCDLDIIIAKFPDHQNKLGLVAIEKGNFGNSKWHAPISKFAQRTNQNNDMEYDVFVPVENVFGIGKGDLAISKAFTWSGPVAGIASVAIARTAYEYALWWAKTFKAAGNVPIIDNQAVGYSLAQCAMKIEACRYLCWKAAHYLDTHNNEGHALAAMAKVYSSETMQQVVIDCMKIVGINSTHTACPLGDLLLEASMFVTYDAGNMGMQMRKIWGVIRHNNYNSTLFRDNDPITFTKDMEFN